MENPIHQRIRQDINSNDIVLFMKGSPSFPQCGFSAAVAQVMHVIGAPAYHAVDVMQDPGVRQGIKEFSQWPTIPQLYVKGEFVGGCDIVREMYETGELQELMQTKGIDLQPQT